MCDALNKLRNAAPSAAETREIRPFQSIDYVELTRILICFFEDNIKVARMRKEIFQSNACFRALCVAVFGLKARLLGVSPADTAAFSGRRILPDCPTFAMLFIGAVSSSLAHFAEQIPLSTGA